MNTEVHTKYNDSDIITLAKVPTAKISQIYLTHKIFQISVSIN